MFWADDKKKVNTEISEEECWVGEQWFKLIKYIFRKVICVFRNFIRKEMYYSVQKKEVF